MMVYIAAQAVQPMMQYRILIASQQQEFLQDRTVEWHSTAEPSSKQKLVAPGKLPVNSDILLLNENRISMVPIYTANWYA